MKAKAWRLYGASDLRLEDVELPAVGADGGSNCASLESAMAAVRALEELGMPFILQHPSLMNTGARIMLQYAA